MKINTACGIWQEDFEEGDDIKILPCKHAFKAEAIMKWLTEEKAECPICRYALESKEIITRNHDQYNHDDQGDDYENDNDDDDNNPQDPRLENQREIGNEPQYNNNFIRMNNITARLVQNIAGRMNHLNRQLPREYEIGRAHV